jgi:hypothetical protein
VDHVISRTEASQEANRIGYPSTHGGLNTYLAGTVGICDRRQRCWRGRDRSGWSAATARSFVRGTHVWKRRVTYDGPARVLALLASVLGMSKESLQKFLQQMDECVELLREADKQHDPEGL